MSRSKIRNSSAFKGACGKNAATQQKRLNEIAATIREIVASEDIHGTSHEVIAWKLRQRGSLGAKDRRKDKGDRYNNLSNEGLRHAICEGLVVLKKDGRSFKAVCTTQPCVPRRVWRKFENKEYPEHLLTVLSDEVDFLCDITQHRYSMLKGVTHKELAYH